MKSEQNKIIIDDEDRKIIISLDEVGIFEFENENIYEYSATKVVMHIRNSEKKFIAYAMGKHCALLTTWFIDEKWRNDSGIVDYPLFSWETIQIEFRKRDEGRKKEINNA